MPERTEAAPAKEQALRQIIGEIGKITGDYPVEADLYNDLALDSFRMVEIFLEVERRFSVSISEDDYLNLRSLRHFLNLLEK